jgi:hypothetical protein
VETRLDGSVDGLVERLGLSATKRHVGNGSLVLGLAGRGQLCLGSLVSSSGVLGGPAGSSVLRPGRW